MNTHTQNLEKSNAFFENISSLFCNALHSISIQATIHSRQQLPASRFICTSTCPQTTSPPAFKPGLSRLASPLSPFLSLADTYIAGFFFGLVLLLSPLFLCRPPLEMVYRPVKGKKPAKGGVLYYHSLTESCWWLDYVEGFKASQGRRISLSLPPRRCKPRHDSEHSPTDRSIYKVFER